jgi:hypothetical protein
MQLELSDEETRALLNLLVETIEADRYRRAPVSTKSTLRPPHCEHLSRLTQSITARSAP